MHDVDLLDYMMKVLLDMNELIASQYVDIYIRCKVLWSLDRFTKYVLGYGDSLVHFTGRHRLEF